MITPRCTDCGSVNLVEDYSDGSLVCRGCGLVVSNFLCDERPLFDHNRNVHSMYYDHTSGEDICREIADAVDRLWPGNDMNWLTIIASKKMEKSSSKSRCARAAHAIFETLKKERICMPLETVCWACGTDVKSVSGLFVENVVDNPINQRIVRLANYFLIDSADRMKAIRVATEVEEALKDDAMFMSKKPSKMDAVILYLVCTQSLGMKMKKSEMVKASDVSNVTFNKHLAFLQSSLLKVGYKI